MRHFLFSADLPDGRQVCVAPISSDAFEASLAHGLGDDSGYFIYEYDGRQVGTGIEVLAKATSYDAALRIIDIFVSVQRSAGIQPSPSLLCDQCKNSNLQTSGTKLGGVVSTF